MTNIVLIGAGGFLGAIARYFLSGYAQSISQTVFFPFGTMAVNLLGCMLIGFLSYLGEVSISFAPEMRLSLMIGFLGSFTTFSTFAHETFELIRDGSSFYAMLNVVTNVVGGGIFLFIGRILGHFFMG